MSTTQTISAKRLAANRANAAKSTGPRTPAGKVRSSQNARKYSFTPASYAVVRIETPELVASLRDDAVATYQPVNSQELFAVERIALAQLNLHRLSAMEAGLFSNYLDAHENPEADQTAGDWTASGFRQLAQESNVISLFLRYQAQAERLYRRAVEDFNRLHKLRSELTEPACLPAEEIPNEATAGEQPDETTTSPLPTPVPNSDFPTPEGRFPHRQSGPQLTSAA